MLSFDFFWQMKQNLVNVWIWLNKMLNLILTWQHLKFFKSNHRSLFTFQKNLDYQDSKRRRSLKEVWQQIWHQSKIRWENPRLDVEDFGQTSEDIRPTDLPGEKRLKRSIWRLQQSFWLPKSTLVMDKSSKKLEGRLRQSLRQPKRNQRLQLVKDVV